LRPCFAPFAALAALVPLAVDVAELDEGVQLVVMLGNEL
jgi:hypothetical protein